MTISQVPGQLQWNPTSLAASGVVATLPSGVTQGNLVTVGLVYGANSAGVTITPPDGSWVQDVLQPSTAFALVAIFHLLVDAGHAGEDSWTFTFSGTAHNGVPIAGEWASTAGWPASPLDKTASTSGSGTALATGTTAATAQASELWVSVFGINAAPATFSGLSAGWSSSAGQLSGDAQSPVNTGLLAWQFASSTGTAAASLTSSQSAAWGGAVAAYKTAVPAPPSGSKPRSPSPVAALLAAGAI